MDHGCNVVIVEAVPGISGDPLPFRADDPYVVIYTCGRTFDLHPELLTYGYLSESDALSGVLLGIAEAMDASGAGPGDEFRVAETELGEPVWFKTFPAVRPADAAEVIRVYGDTAQVLQLP